MWFIANTSKLILSINFNLIFNLSPLSYKNSTLPSQFHSSPTPNPPRRSPTPSPSPISNSKKRTGHTDINTITNCCISIYRSRSARSEPNLRDGRHTGVQLVVQISWQLVVILVAGLVQPVGCVAPPAVHQEAEHEGDEEAGVEVWSVDVEETVALEGASGSGPQSAGAGQGSSLGNKPYNQYNKYQGHP